MGKFTWKSSYQDQIALRNDEADKLYRTEGKVLISGHRGAKALFPENTLFSFQKALDMGVDSLEMDVNRTKDGINVVCHDNTLDRTTNGTGYIHDYTLEEIKKLNAGYHFAEGKFRGQGLEMPTLEEFAELLEPYHHIMLNVEIKEKTKDTVDETMATFGHFNMLSRCVFTCFDAEIVHYMYDTYHVKTQGFVKTMMGNFDDSEKGTYSKLYAVGLSMNDLTPENVQFFEEQGILAWCWCPDTEETVQQALQMKARLMTCNDPCPALKIIKKTCP